MSYLELYEMTKKIWLNTKDIMIIAGCGKNHAAEIRKEIEKKVLSSGKKLPVTNEKVVPSVNVLNYFGIDIDYVIEMAKHEKEFNETTIQSLKIGG